MPAPQKSAGLSAGDIEERVSILKRFRSLLLEQRDIFQNCLLLLDKQKDVINSGDIESLNAHVDIEEKIISSVFLIQKSIEPMRALYESAWSDKKNVEISGLANTLESLKIETGRRMDENRSLLRSKMTGLGAEIKSLHKTNPFAKKQVYGGSGQASLLDIKG